MERDGARWRRAGERERDKGERDKGKREVEVVVSERRR